MSAKPKNSENMLEALAAGQKETGKIAVMNAAKRAKNDEFYTRYEDIEREILCYEKSVWENRVVFCNCDTPANKDNDRKASAFAMFFLKNFNTLKLKKLICLHYTGGRDLFHAARNAYVFTKDEFEETTVFFPNFSGGFDDPMSVKILNEEADIVCTNPPFSKSKEYWKLLIASGKKFLIISNITLAVHSQWIAYFRQNLVWGGYSEVDWYINPKLEQVRAAGFWFTNLPTQKTYKNLKFKPLSEIQDQDNFFDDQGILCVNHGNIPTDYMERFAVSARAILNGVLECGYEIADEREYLPYRDGKCQFSRCLIRKKKGDGFDKS